MKALILFINLILVSATVGQNISKKEALNIAKTDSIFKIKSAELMTDSTTKILFWRIEEKVNLKKEQRKVVKSKTTGIFKFYSRVIKINATTGQVFYRENKFLGAVHKQDCF